MEDLRRFSFSDNDGERELAVRVAPGSKADVPGFVWLGGYRSDMAGTKAQVMVDTAADLGGASMRFDYSGHGESGGDFLDGSISMWVAETVAVFREFTNGPQIILGSSMGGWIALRLVQELQKLSEQDRIGGLLLIAPAPDFTSELMEVAFTDEQRETMARVGHIEEESQYSDDPNIITKKLIEDGRANSVLSIDLKINAPVHILQGMEDPDVPYTHAQKLMTALPHDDVTMTMIKQGDHRLSRDEDLEILKRTMRGFVE